MSKRPTLSPSYALLIGAICFSAGLLVSSLLWVLTSERPEDVLPTLVSFPATETGTPPISPTAQATATSTISAPEIVITDSISQAESVATMTDSPTIAPSATITPTAQASSTTSATITSSPQPVPQQNLLPGATVQNSSQTVIVIATPTVQPPTALPSATIAVIASATPQADTPAPEVAPFDETLEIGGGRFYVLQIERDAARRMQESGTIPPAIPTNQEWVLVELMYLCPANASCQLPGLQIQLFGSSGTAYTVATVNVEPAFRISENVSGQVWGFLAFTPLRSEQQVWLSIGADERNSQNGG
jgi:hypothetical protein